MRSKKQHGVHYTPPALAQFLARQTAACCQFPTDRPTVILDPACGDGELLIALIEALRANSSKTTTVIEIEVVGYETDPQAAKRAERRLQSRGLREIQINNEDFLTSDAGNRRFDCVIANPPYVRTQVLGGAAAQQLAKKFRLTGRVDLYHAFSVAIGELLRPGGALGLLTSNRFLTVRSGAAMRQQLRSEYEIQQVFDLGDTRMFEAAVLPVVLVGVKREHAGSAADGCDETFEKDSGTDSKFSRVYRSSATKNPRFSIRGTVLDAVEDRTIAGEVTTREGRFLIERGALEMGQQATHEEAQRGSVWRMVNPASRKWLSQVRANQSQQFGDLAEIKVGIKTTADAVFIRENWETFADSRPEPDLIFPLITHHDARRWNIETPLKSVLYPYDVSQTKRTPVPLETYPRAAAYLADHRERLEGRRYVVDSGREWYEIWVPQQPARWSDPKLVWPDISEAPKFFLDSTGAIVNGDCYWIKLRDSVDPDWLYLMLAVANSNLATRFYDTVFHNKLYAGRRRYMTQYVESFPLPRLNTKLAQQIVTAVKRLVHQTSETGKRHADELKADELQLDRWVESAFGF